MSIPVNFITKKGKGYMKILTLFLLLSLNTFAAEGDPITINFDAGTGLWSCSTQYLGDVGTKLTYFATENEATLECTEKY